MVTSGFAAPRAGAVARRGSNALRRVVAGSTFAGRKWPMKNTFPSVSISPSMGTLPRSVISIIVTLRRPLRVRSRSKTGVKFSCMFVHAKFFSFFDRLPLDVVAQDPREAEVEVAARSGGDEVLTFARGARAFHPDDGAGQPGRQLVRKLGFAELHVRALRNGLADELLGRVVQFVGRLRLLLRDGCRGGQERRKEDERVFHACSETALYAAIIPHRRSVSACFARSARPRQRRA